jgi:hypothetical protein
MAMAILTQAVASSRGPRVAEEQHDGVADEFVDGRAVLERDR